MIERRKGRNREREFGIDAVLMAVTVNAMDGFLAASAATGEPHPPDVPLPDWPSQQHSARQLTDRQGCGSPETYARDVPDPIAAARDIRETYASGEPHPPPDSAP